MLDNFIVAEPLNICLTVIKFKSLKIKEIELRETKLVLNSLRVNHFDLTHNSTVV